MNRAQLLLARFDGTEYRLCRGLNTAANRTWVLKLMRLCSRLGDGMLWYGLMGGLLLVYGREASRAVLIMGATGLAGYLIYRRLKSSLVRERPFIRHPGITMAMPPLDRYSFPSGHTLHAVSFTWQACAAFPELVPVFVPLALAIAASRVVLGLHYPTDVLVGALIGATFAAVGSAVI